MGWIPHAYRCLILILLFAGHFNPVFSIFSERLKEVSFTVQGAAVRKKSDNYLSTNFFNIPRRSGILCHFVSHAGRRLEGIISSARTVVPRLRMPELRQRHSPRNRLILLIIPPLWRNCLYNSPCLLNRRFCHQSLLVLLPTPFPRHHLYPAGRHLPNPHQNKRIRRSSSLLSQRSSLSPGSGS